MQELTTLRNGNKKKQKTKQNKIDHTDKKRHHNKTMEQTVLAVKQQIKQLDEE